MISINHTTTAGHIIEKAKSLGVSLAGITRAASLQNAPSYEMHGKDDRLTKTNSVLILALAHDVEKPELDWWDGDKGTPGNRRLIEISRKLADWAKKEFDIEAQDLRYHVEKGGVFLKDAAVLAGLGVIGKNNLLITPEYGPRVRLRAMFIDMRLEESALNDFAPCLGCDMPCRNACPRNAVKRKAYSRSLCNIQMKTDEHNTMVMEAGKETPVRQRRIKYCRACELECPVGR